MEIGALCVNCKCHIIMLISFKLQINALKNVCIYKYINLK